MVKMIGVFRTKRLFLRRNGRCGLLRQKWRISQAPVIKRVWSWDRSCRRGTCRSKRSPLMVTACTAPWRTSWRSEAHLSALKSFGLKQLSTWGAMQTTSCRSSLTPIQETCTLQVNAIFSPYTSEYDWHIVKTIYYYNFRELVFIWIYFKLNFQQSSHFISLTWSFRNNSFMLICYLRNAFFI